MTLYLVTAMPHPRLTGAAVYLRTVHLNTDTSVSLVVAKSWLAPMKSQTIPRLELYGAELLSKLLSQVSKDLSLHQESVFAWTDSAVVLGWFKTTASHLFVWLHFGQ